MKNDIVCKFGGTSLANSENIKKVKEIVISGKKRFVVVSAPGKRFKDDIKITDCLINSFNKSKNGETFETEFSFFKNRFEEISKEFNLDVDLSSSFQDLHNKILEHKDFDYVVSRGEFFSAKLIALVLGYTFLDARSFITFLDNKKVDLNQTRQKFNAIIKPNQNYVISGFYGADAKGNIVTFSRGGSDISGAIVSVVANAKVYENWTDVDGFLSADPKLCKGANLIDKLSYHELRELSYMGANVLHPDCVKFLRENNIILNLRNTFNPSCKGSLIMPDNKKLLQSKLTGIAGQKGFTIIHIDKFDINESLGIIEKIANIIKKYNISIEHIPTGIDTVSVIVKTLFLSDEIRKNMIDDINIEIKPDRLEIIDNVALISVVGNILRDDRNIEKKVFDALFSSNTKIITLNKGADGISVIFGVPEKSFDKTISVLYNMLFS